VDKYWNFALATFVTSAIIFQARSDSSTKIAWTEVKRDDLFFGTDYGEYSAKNLNPQTVLNASNPPKTERHTSFGSARIPAVLVGSDMSYISADKKKCRFLSFDGLERDGFRSYDMTHRAPRVAGSGFLGHVLQRTPYPVLWFWTADGNAVSFTVDRENGRLAWAQHSTANGLIKSLCVIPDENGIDEIYAVVGRTNRYGTITDIDTSPTVDTNEYAPSIEYPDYEFVQAFIDSETGEETIAPEPAYGIKLISGKYTLVEIPSDNPLAESTSLDGIWTAVSPVTGTMEGFFPTFFVEKLDYTESTHTDSLWWGINNNNILSQWEPTPLSRGPKFLDGNQKFRSARVILYVTESNGGEVSIDGGNTWTALDYSKLTADANGLYTGFVEVRKQSGWEDFISPKVRTTGTDPLNVSAIKMPIEKGDRGSAK